MKAQELHNFLQTQGPWVNWKHTTDHFLFGDPAMEIKGIAVGWMPTFPNLKKAFEAGCNLFITHEPLYIAACNEFGVYVGGSLSDITQLGKEGSFVEEDHVWVKKFEWLRDHQMTVYRCHDVWDDFPEIGIHGAWARWLGLTGPIVSQEKFYEVRKVGPIPLGDLIKKISKPLANLGQIPVQVIGDLNREVNNIAIGTGAITNYAAMYAMGADVLLLTDDGTRLWESGQWAEDSGIPVIIVNHATAEEPGIRALAKYLHTKFPAIPITPIERGCLYRSI